MISIIVSTLIAFLLGITVGFFIGKQKVLEQLKTTVINLGQIAKNEKLKVLHKSEPKTLDEKRSEALDEDKQITKTFYK